MDFSVPGQDDRAVAAEIVGLVPDAVDRMIERNKTTEGSADS